MTIAELINDPFISANSLLIEGVDLVFGNMWGNYLFEN